MVSYKIKERIVYENMSSEVIIINFNTGDYYSLRGTAQAIWAMLEKQASEHDFVSMLIKHYPINPEMLAHDVSVFLETLTKEGLVEAIAYEQLDNIFSDVCVPGEYLPPQMLKYSDIDQLLLLDPIHDVQETGWPNRVET